MSDAAASPASAPAQPLAGIQVVELTHWMAGPLAGGLLADWGASVVRIEPPGGDPMRALFASIGAKADTPNGAFIAANRGKRSIELEIKRADHRAVFDRLLEQADVFLTNLRPDALQRLRLSPTEVAARFPRLVYGTVSAYGWGGPDQDRPGYDIAAFFGRSGIAHQITTQGDAPAALMQGIGDAFTAMSAATGILAALLERQHSGRGRCVEASLMRTGMWALAGELGVQAMGGLPLPPAPRAQCRTPMYNSYRSGDGQWFFLVGVQARRHLPAVLAAIDRPELVHDERFATARAMSTHRQALIELLDAAFAAQPMSHWASRFDEHQVWWARVQTPADVVHDRQAQAIGAWVEVEGLGPKTWPSVDAPIRFDGVARQRVRGPGAAGADTQAVLRELGYDDAAIAALRAPAATAST